MKKQNFNYHSSYLGNICPKRTSGRLPGTSFGNKIRRCTDNMYTYVYICIHIPIYIYKIKQI